MTKKPQTSKEAADKVVKNIRRKTRQTNLAEENIPIFYRQACAGGEHLGAMPPRWYC